MIWRIPTLREQVYDIYRISFGVVVGVGWHNTAEQALVVQPDQHSHVHDV